MKKLCSLIFLLFFTHQAQAALITSLSNVSISGTNYDVTFHTDGVTHIIFNAIWDANDDGIFANSDGSILSSAPTFWQDPTGANAARDAIISALGLVDHTSVFAGSLLLDLFAIPFRTNSGSITAGVDVLNARGDQGNYPSDDTPGNTSNTNDFAVPFFYPWVSFQAATTPAVTVPAPSAFLLILWGLLALGYRQFKASK